MLEIRVHGRGGQGAVIASKILAAAAFKEGKHVQAFPAFGVERRGAPVAAFARLAEQPILLRCQIYEPDHVIVLDATLFQAVDVTAGLRPGGWVLINSDRPPAAFGLGPRFRPATVDAGAIAAAYHLGPRNAPIVNTAILGAFAAATGIVGLDAVLAAIREAAPVDTEQNLAAAREAHERVQV